MTTEETELTFVRCPNCRSLIPAIATRCRMCGTQFEKKADGPGEAAPAADPSQGQKQSRVRQRTISASPDEVDHLKRTVGETGEPPRNGTPEAVPFRFGALASEGAPATKPPIPPSFQAAQPGPAVHDEEHEPVEEDDQDSLFDDVDDAYLRPDSIDDEGVGDENIAREEPRVDDSADRDEDEWSDDAELEDDVDDIDAHEEERPSSQPTGEKKRRRRRRRKKRGPTSEITAGSFERAETPTSAAPRMHPVHEVSETMSRPEEEAYSQPVQRPEPVRREPEQRAPEHRHSEQRGAEQVKSDGALVGWLVDYSLNARGNGIELRAGKFFVGRQKLRGNDLVLSHQSISTPHCMIVAGGPEGLTVQDLMSEGGTYLRRGSGGSYSPVHNTTPVEHGDWLKFGEYEVLVCLVPQAGRGRR